MPDGNEINEVVGDLLSQLEASNKQIKKPPVDHPELKKEDIENYVVKKAGELVNHSIDVLEDIKGMISSSPTPDDIAALSSLVNATATALDTLNKLNITDKKNQTLIKVKEMDVESRKEMLQADGGVTIKLTREEMLKQLAQILDKSRAVEAEVIPLDNKKEI